MTVYLIKIKNLLKCTLSIVNNKKSKFNVIKKKNNLSEGNNFFFLSIGLKFDGSIEV